MNIKNQYGYSLLEVMVAASVGVIFSLTLASVSVDISKQNKSVRSQAEYVAVATQFSTALKNIRECNRFFNEGNYSGLRNASDTDDDGEPEEDGLSVVLAGQTVKAGDVVRGTSIRIKNIVLEDQFGGSSPITFVENGVDVPHNRYITNIVLSVEYSDAVTGTRTPRALTIPLVIISENSTGKIKYCNGSSEEEACSLVGGQYFPANPNAIPPEPARCDVLKNLGGCMKGGVFSFVNGTCVTGNPLAQGACACPTDPDGLGAYAEITTTHYAPTKDAEFVQKECVRCKINGNPVDISGLFDPTYDEDTLDKELACLQGLSSCPCSNPTSVACTCYNNPSSPACTAAGVCAAQNPPLAEDSCDCMLAKMSVLDPTSTEYQTLLAQYYAAYTTCYSCTWTMYGGCY